MKSSPVLPIMVRSWGGTSLVRPLRSFAAPTPPASATVFIVFGSVDV